MAFEVENLAATVADLRARGVTFERFEMAGLDVRSDTIAAVLPASLSSAAIRRAVTGPRRGLSSIG